ncbi:class I SAM-dependent methyltransferase [Gemmatimonadota bacterium]
MIGDHYKWLAHLYDPVVGRFNRNLRAIAISMLPPCEGASVLDVGCGTGMYLELYSRPDCQISGIDLSPAMLAIARKRLGSQAHLLLEDASQMPYEDETFDIVLASLFLHELSPETRSAIMDQMKRVLKPDGRMLITDFHPGPFAGAKGYRMNIIITIAEQMAGRDHFRNSRVFLARQGMLPLIEEHGMRIEEMKVISGGTLGLYLIQKG